MMYIRKQSGTKSVILHTEVMEIMEWAVRSLPSIGAIHIKGELYQKAEWCLNQEVFSLILQKFGLLAVDLFASHKNAISRCTSAGKQTPKFLGMGALSSNSYKNSYVYSFPFHFWER